MVDLNDVTSMYTVINVVGPKAAELLNELSNSNMTLAPFSYKKVNVGYASDVMVMSFTHTGEPGYCLYIPSEYALHVYYRLMTVSKIERCARVLNIKPTGGERLWCTRCRNVDAAFYEDRAIYTILGRRTDEFYDTLRGR